MSLREIGDFFGGLNYAAVAQRLRRLISEDKQEAARLLSKCQKNRCDPRLFLFTRAEGCEVPVERLSHFPRADEGLGLTLETFLRG
jgi:hypothetical protein